MPIRKCQVADITPGMILARAVKLNAQTILVQPGVTINERMLQMLVNRGIEQVYVKDVEEAGEGPAVDTEKRCLVAAREEMRFGNVASNPLHAAVMEAVIDLKTALPDLPGTCERPEPPPPRRSSLADEIHLRAKKTRQLPTLPVIYQEIDAITKDPYASAADVSQVVNGGPAFASALLRLANSALYARPEPVTTVTRAVSLLGHKEIRELCLMTCVLEIMALSGDRSLPVETFWQHAVATAAAAKVIGQEQGVAVAEELFLAGLLHDIGMLFWLRFYPDELAAIFTAAEGTGRTVYEVERERMGTSHPRLGRMIGQQWRLPRAYVEVIATHHAPDQADNAQLLSATVHVANTLVHALELSGASLAGVPVIANSAWEALRLDMDELPNLLELIRAEFAESKKSFAAYMHDRRTTSEAVRHEA